jgi:hypothetical protein
VAEDRTGVFFDRPEPAAIAEAIERLRARHWDAAEIARHAEGFSEGRFIARLREIVGETLEGR